MQKKMMIVKGMKVGLSWMLCVSLLVSCTATSKRELNQLRIVTTFYPIYIATINITKDVPGVSVMNMTKTQTGCLHDYSLTPTDMKTLEKADILVINGAGMESFMGKVIQEFPHLKVIEASKNIELLKDAGSGEPNPHVWVSISGAISQLDNIANELSVLDPLRKQLYQDNAKIYKGKLDSLRNKMHRELKEIKTNEVITFHEAFPYFAKEFQFSISAVIEQEPGLEPSPKEMVRLIQKIQKLPSKIVFVEPQYSSKTATILATETGASIYELDPVVTGDGSLVSYLKIMEHNLIILKKALS